MSFQSLPPVVLSLLLQLMPLARIVVADSALAAAPMMAIFRLLVGATAVAGSYHAVSGASITVTEPPGLAVTRTNGVASGFNLSLKFMDGRVTLVPQLYTAENLPPGFDQPSRSGQKWRITCLPTQTGVFEDVFVTGWKTDTSDPEHSATITIKVTVVDGAPSITTQPASLTVDEGATATFSVVAAGGNLTYQWQKGGLEITGATSDTLTIDPVRLEDAGNYRVFVQNSGGGVLSDPALLTVNAGTQKPILTTFPQDAFVHAGETVTLTSAASGPGPLSFQWLKGGDPIAGEEAQELFLAAVTLEDAGSYTVAVTGPGGTTTSPPAQLLVTAPLTIGEITLEADQLRLPFHGIEGRSYRLESALNLTDLEWLPVTETVGTGGESAFTTPLDAAPLKSYRIRGL